MVYHLWFRRLAIIAAVVCFGMIALGAFVRMSNAGLSCPTWPLCYGYVTPPDTMSAIHQVEQAYAGHVVHVDRAWKEMIHRYLAGILGSTILIFTVLAILNRRDPEQPVALPVAISLLVVAQALFGMWTVTLELDPIVVSTHLLGGMLLFALLIWLALRSGRGGKLARGESFSPVVRKAAFIALPILFLQLFLGAWTSTNYAGLACMGFPSCNGSWWPAHLQWGEAFQLWHRLGVDYNGGVLGYHARMTIQFVHRLWAGVTVLYLGTLGGYLLVRKGTPKAVRALGALLVGLLGVQVGLGAAMVDFGLPTNAAVGHTANAAMLLATLVSINFAVRERAAVRTPAYHTAAISTAA